VSRLTLHMLPGGVWDRHDPAEPYAPAAFADEGFVHCTDGDAGMVATANRFYRDDPSDFVVLTVDLDATGSPWRFDDAEQQFPHVYGRINAQAVVAVRRLVRASDGTFTGIEAIEPG
jgi:uncharacterized protein (DUF952 family)